VATVSHAVWSLGATLFCLAFGYSPFECARTDDGKLRVAECSHVRVLGPVLFPVGHNYSHAFCDLILWMLNKDMDARPSIDDVAARLDAMGAAGPPVHRDGPGGGGSGSRSGAAIV
jgi:serine/threonine kinase 16